jgi:tRNA (cytidine/uridine-2'-O-)-methyltransferase
MTLHVALIEPQIPPNTGNVMRLCAGADVPLHLIGPIGFPLDGPDVKRAAVEHRDKVDLWEHPDWFAFRDAISRDRCIYFTTDARVDYTRRRSARTACSSSATRRTACRRASSRSTVQRCYRIPSVGMLEPEPANAVSVVLYEGLRQLGQGGTAPVFEGRRGRGRGAEFQSRPQGCRDVPAIMEPEEEDEINYNVEQKPRVSPPAGRGPRGGAGRGGPRGVKPSGPGPTTGPGPRGGGRPRRGRGGRGKPKP